MGRRAITGRGVLWGLGAAMACGFLAFAVAQAMLAAELRQRLERRLAEPPLRLSVDLSRPGTYSVDGHVPYYGYLGTEFKLGVTPPFPDPSALLQSLSGFKGTVSFRQAERGTGPLPVTAADFRDASQDLVRHTEAKGAYLLATHLTGDGRGQLELTVLRPAPTLAGREQVLEARPVMDPFPALVPIYISWTLAAISFAIGAATSIVLVRAKVRGRRRMREQPL